MVVFTPTSKEKATNSRMILLKQTYQVVSDLLGLKRNKETKKFNFRLVSKPTETK